MDTRIGILAQLMDSCHSYCADNGLRVPNSVFQIHGKRPGKCFDQGFTGN